MVDDEEQVLAVNVVVSEAERRRAWAAKREADYKAIVKAFEPVDGCPLIQPFTRFMGVEDRVLKHLYLIRKGGSFVPKPVPGISTEKPPRGYQALMAEHLYHMPRFICGDGVGLGKTYSAIVALTRRRNVLAAEGVCSKVIILTTTSTAYQWESEIKRFSDLKPWVLRDAFRFADTKKTITGHEARKIQLQKFLEHPRLNVLVCRYSQWLGTRRAVSSGSTSAPVEDGKELLSPEMMDFRAIVGAAKRDRLTLILDETHRIKTPGSSARNLIQSVNYRFGKIIAMTATPIKNRLDEFYSIASAIGISPLLSLPYFIKNACILQKTWMRGGRVSKTVIAGYRPEAIVKFRIAIRPWYWGRTQVQVNEPMPKLKTEMHPVDLDKATMKLLLEDIPSGLYVLPPALKKVAGEMQWVERDPSNLMAQPLNAKVLTPSGWRYMGDLQVGDLVIDPDGGVARIDGISSRRLQAVYRVVTKHGASTECSGDHLWTVKRHHFRRRGGPEDNWVTEPLNRLVDEGLTRTCSAGFTRYHFGLPTSKPVEFEISNSTPLVIPPYTMGALLGDGSFLTTVKLAATEEHVVERVRGELPNGMFVGHYTNMQPSGKKGVYHNLSSNYVKGCPRSKSRNPYIAAAKALGVWGVHTHSKRVPPRYLVGTQAERLELLQGLMDTDGCCTTQGHAMFACTSHGLCEDVAEVVRSLGGRAQIRSRRPGQGPRSSPVTVVDIWAKTCPFSMPRKVARWRPSLTVDSIKTVDYVGNRVCQCIHVTSKRHLYVTDDYIPTHNTALSVMSMGANSPALLDPGNPKIFLNPKLSPKEEELLDLLDGDLEDEKVIVFTKYRSHIDRIQYLTEQRKFTQRPFLRITGLEGGKLREANRLKFQEDPNYNLIVINTAGIEGINLQQAAHMICLDLPWSWGDLLQLVGRMVRMASPHAACLLHILFACGTVDEYILETLKSKKGLFERILGTSGSAGLLDDGEINIDEAMKGLEGEGTDDKFYDMLRAHAKDIGLRPYAFGEVLAQERAGMRTRTRMPGMKSDVAEEAWLANW